MTVHIIDYGVCNLGSVRRAFEECGASHVLINEDPSTLHQASRIVLPGVGAFADAMQVLEERGWSSAIRQMAQEKQIPILGICLGMQLFATFGDEGGGHKGLNLIPGSVQRIDPTERNLRIPHVGWNEIKIAQENAIVDRIADGSDFYFVHSYHFIPENSENILLKTPYGTDLVAAVRAENVVGVQFHPEKSGRAGFQVIKNFMEI